MNRIHLTTCMALGISLAGSACDGIQDASQPGNLVPRTVDEDPTLSAIELNHTKLHFATFGDPSRPVIVFLHGGPGTDFREMLRMNQRYGDGYALADDHYLVFWDQRGSGLSRRHDCGTYTLDVIDQDLDAVIDHFSPGRSVILVGHSWGGMYATAYLNRHPDKVAAAVLIEPGPLNAAMFDSVSSQIIDFDVFSEWLNDFAWDSQFLSPDDHARADYHMLEGLRDSQPRFHQQTAIDPAPVWRLGAVASRCIQQLGMRDGKATYDFTDHLAAFTKPVRFIASGENEVIGVAFQQRQRALFPNADLAVVAGAGHDLTWTRPAETVAAIHSYLTAVSQ